MFTLPCSTDGCTGLVEDGRPKCPACFDRNGYPEGGSRKRYEAWLNGRPIHEIRSHPIEGPGCNNHPVTPRPDFCVPCKALTNNESKPVECGTNTEEIR